MNQELLDKLKVISPEEEQILAGETEVQKSIYTAADDFIVDGSQMLDAGKLIDIRPHTRFVHFPRHKHNYIEIITCAAEPPPTSSMTPQKSLWIPAISCF